MTIISVCLSLIVAGCACPSAEPTPTPPPTPPAPSAPPVSLEYAEKLAERFCPIIYLKGEGEATENYEPEPIEIMVDEALVRDIEDPAFSQKATLSGLVEWSKSIYYLDLAKAEAGSESFPKYKLNYEEAKDSYPPTIYARVLEGNEPSHTVVQYWIFYYFNDWRNFHEGDWELIQLNFPGDTAQELLENEELPLFAAYSQHQTGQKLAWSEMINQAMVAENHPLVYVAQGSHANYFAPGNFWSGLDFDDTGLASWQILSPEHLELVLLPETAAEAPDWLKFKGYWGEYLGFKVSVLGLNFWQRGPFGPGWGEGEQPSQKWTDPQEWAQGLAEYPKPFWTSLIKLPGDWSKLAVFSLFSPAELHIYDSQGRHVGIDADGEPEIQIPGALYITPEGSDYKTILIPDADVTEEYSIVVKGTDTGMMDLKAQVPDEQQKAKRFLEYTNVPITATLRARANIKPEIPGVAVAEVAVRTETQRDISTKLELDSNGDGVFDLELTPGAFAIEKVEKVDKVEPEPNSTLEQPDRQ